MSLIDEVVRAQSEEDPLVVVNGWLAEMGESQITEWPGWDHMLPLHLGNPLARALGCRVFVYGEGDYAVIVSRHPRFPGKPYNTCLWTQDGVVQSERVVGRALAQVAWSGIRRTLGGWITRCGVCGLSLGRPQADLNQCCLDELPKWRDES